MADTAINYDNNPYSAIELWNTTVESAQKYIEKTSGIIKINIMINTAKIILI